MAWTQLIDYVEIDAAPPRPVIKQVWNGTQFVKVTQFRQSGLLTDAQTKWLNDTFGKRGPRWDYSPSGNFWVMDEQVYMMFRLKWGTK